MCRGASRCHMVGRGDARMGNRRAPRGRPAARRPRRQRAYPAIDVEICMTLVMPADAQRVPVMIMFGGGALPAEAIAPDALPEACRPPARPAGAPPAARHRPGADAPATEQLIAAGWGFASLRPTSIQADNGAGLTRGIIGLVNKGQPRKPDDWGALRAWAWGASRGARLSRDRERRRREARRHRRRLALRQGRARRDGVRYALRRRARRLIGRGRREAAPPQFRRGSREPDRQRRVPLDGRQLPEVRRRGSGVRQHERRRPAGRRARADRALRAAARRSSAMAFPRRATRSGSISRAASWRRSRRSRCSVCSARKDLGKSDDYAPRKCRP